MLAAILLGTALPLLGAVINAAFGVGYIHATFAGRRRPSLVSWLIWAATALISLVAAWAAGSSRLMIVASAAILPVGVLLGLASQGLRNAIARHDPRVSPVTVPEEPRFSWQPWVDGACLLGCVLALAGWWATADPLVALVLSVTTHLVAAGPTFVRTWRREESPWPYVGGALNSVFTLLVLTSARPQDVIFPAYLFAFCAAMAVFCACRQPARYVGRHRQVDRSEPRARLAGHGSRSTSTVPVRPGGQGAIAAAVHTSVVAVTGVTGEPGASPVTRIA